MGKFHLKINYFDRHIVAPWTVEVPYRGLNIEAPELIQLNPLEQREVFANYNFEFSPKLVMTMTLSDPRSKILLMNPIIRSENGRINFILINLNSHSVTIQKGEPFVIAHFTKTYRVKATFSFIKTIKQSLQKALF
jgi:hypothetical protein